MQEYQTHRDEITNRINLQNSMAERGINLTVITVSLLAALFSFLLKDFGSPNAPAASDPQVLARNLNLFVTVSIPILIVYGVLVQLTLAVWIYQLAMMFRMVRYWNWLTATSIDGLVGKTEGVFLWDRLANPPWTALVDKQVVKYFQALFVYVLCSLSIAGLVAAVVWKIVAGKFLIAGLLGAIGICVLSLTLGFLFLVHMKVVHATELSQTEGKSATDSKESKE